MPTGDLTYTPDIAGVICRRLADGESLRSICRTPNYPPHSTVLSWVKDNVAGFADQYAQAREIGYLILAEEILEVADNGANDWMEINEPENPGYKFNGEHVQRSKLRVETRKWMLSKMLPKIYGDKLPDQLPAGAGQSFVVVMPGKSKDADAWVSSTQPE